MRITADTNVLVRALTEDDPRQSRAAQAEMVEASLIAVPTPALCELVWVLSRSYGLGRMEIVETLRDLIDIPTVRVDRPSVEAGLAVLEAGGDFADGVIAFEGTRLGADTFVSFDKHAVELIGQGQCPARLLA